MTDISRNTPRASAPAPAGNTATGWLKLIALVFMFVDHSGKVLFNNMTEMRTLGRIAFPIYVWCMIVGFYRTRNVHRYLLRILLVGLISQPLYLLALNTQGQLDVLVNQTVQPLSGGFSFSGLRDVLYTVFMEKPNIFLTLLMGLIALCAIREKHWLRQSWIPCCVILVHAVLELIHTGQLAVITRTAFAPLSGGFSFAALEETLAVVFVKTPNYFFLILLACGLLWGFSQKDRRPGQVWVPAAMIILATVLKADYGWKGILLFVLIYAAQDSRPALTAVMVSYFMFWGSSYSVTTSLLGQKIDLTLLPDSLSGPVRTLLRSEAYALMGLPLILIRFPRDFRMPKWLSYALYPAHLAILILLKYLMFGLKIS